jgi:hypothetical protein
MKWYERKRRWKANWVLLFAEFHEHLDVLMQDWEQDSLDRLEHGQPGTAVWLRAYWERFVDLASLLWGVLPSLASPPQHRMVLVAGMCDRVEIAAREASRMPTQAEALAFLRQMDRDADDYFYVLDASRPRFVMHSRQPAFEESDLQSLRANDGSFPGREIVARAKAGGGLVRYRWARPSSGREEAKLAYLVAMPRWGWVVGNGVYVAGIDHEMDPK